MKASLAGMRQTPGDICISLGTSDTLFVWTYESKAVEHGHVFINPCNTENFMALLWFYY